MSIDTGTTSIHVTKKDKEIFEKYEMHQKQIGKAYHDAVKAMDKLIEYRNERKQELREQVNEIREEAEALGIDRKEINL